MMKMWRKQAAWPFLMWAVLLLFVLLAFGMPIFARAFCGPWASCGLPG